MDRNHFGKLGLFPTFQKLAVHSSNGSAAGKWGVETASHPSHRRHFPSGSAFLSLFFEVCRSLYTCFSRPAWAFTSSTTTHSGMVLANIPYTN